MYCSSTIRTSHLVGENSTRTLSEDNCATATVKWPFVRSFYKNCIQNCPVEKLSKPAICVIFSDVPENIGCFESFNIIHPPQSILVAGQLQCPWFNSGKRLLLYVVPLSFSLFSVDLQPATSNKDKNAQKHNTKNIIHSPLGNPAKADQTQACVQIEN